jgi:hypothetical protein
MGLPSRANPTEVEDFGDEDLLQNIDLARIIIGEAQSLPPGSAPSGKWSGQAILDADCGRTRLHKKHSDGYSA